MFRNPCISLLSQNILIQTVTYIILTLDSELSTVKIYAERRNTMNVEKVGENYRCNICGNEVTVTKAGGGELVCCGEPMERI